MSSPLREHQHEISDVNGNGGIVFGTQDTGYLTTTRPTIAQGEARVNDVERPQEDGIMFGRDYRGSKTYAFEMTVITDDLNRLGGDNPHRANLDYLEALESKWTSREYRRDPTKFAMLRSCEGGVTSRCYGRPRRWDEAASNLTQQGYTPVVADFALIDNQWYSDIETTVEISIDQGNEGGFIAPIKAPIRTTSATTGILPFIIGGTQETWVVFEIFGNVSNPVLRVDNKWSVGFNGSLATGESVVIDPRPWVRSAIKYPSNAPVAGALSTNTPAMRDMLVAPGRHTLTMTGVSLTGSAYARLRWRTARSRP